VTTRRPELGLGTRLFLAQTLTAGVAALTLWAVAAAVGPAIFHAHLHRAAGVVPAETSRHVEEAFSSASAISIGVALVASLATALAVSAYVARRIAGPVGRLARAVQELASGCYNVRVPPAALGPEFATLTGSFNEMAGRLGSIETTRRRLLADLGHEMRTPLATLDAYLDGLEDGVVALEPASLAVLRTQTRRLTRLTEDITAVSRAEEHQLDLHLRPTTVNALTAAALTAAADRFRGRGVDLIIQAVPEQLPVVVDPDRIGQVLGNLRAVLPRRLRPGSGSRRIGDRAGDRQGPGRGPRRPDRRDQRRAGSRQHFAGHPAACRSSAVAVQLPVTGPGRRGDVNAGGCRQTAVTERGRRCRGMAGSRGFSGRHSKTSAADATGPEREAEPRPLCPVSNDNA